MDNDKAGDSANATGIASADTCTEHDALSGSAEQNSSSNPHRGQLDAFQRLDQALGRYYAARSVTDYFSSDGRGRFLEFCAANGFDDEDNLALELEHLENCALLDFDPHFPVTGTGTREQCIFEVLRRCHREPDAAFAPQPPIDVSLFERTGTRCGGSFDECECLNRVLQALAFYETLRPAQSASDASRFRAFVSEHYPRFIDDVNHVVVAHEHDLEHISDALQSQGAPCDERVCAQSARHFGASDVAYVDADFAFFAETMDAMHCFLRHLFHFGMRTRANESVDVKGNRQRHRARSHKFQIESVSAADAFSVHGNEANGTLMDALFRAMARAEPDTARVVAQYLRREHFDSEALCEDVRGKESSNVWRHSSEQLLRIARQLIEHKECMSLCVCGLVERHARVLLSVRARKFSTGFIFFYWKQPRVSDDNVLLGGVYEDHNDYGGYSVYELFIPSPKHAHLKDEILSNDDNEINAKEYRSKVLFKAQQLMKSEAIKQLQAHKYGGSCWIANWIDCDVSENDPIREEHVVSLILYCDFDALSTALSSTFRRREPFEPLASVKRRNRRYWHLSKLLRESVQLFGMCNCQDRSYHKACPAAGPFFCGVNRVLLMPSFSIRLCAPTSTSKSLSVALNFATTKGLIVTLNNEKLGFAGGKALNHFDVRCVSKYKEENERLWIGGSERIEIESVRMVIESVWKSQRKYFTPLYYLDAVLNGSRWRREWTSSQISIVCALMTGNTSSFPEYVVETWKLFCIEKKTMIIDLDIVERYPSWLKDLMFYSFVGAAQEKRAIADVEIASDSNLIRASFMALFPNAHFWIDCSGAFVFSLNRWARECVKANISKCSLVGTRDDRKVGSWLCAMYPSLVVEDSSIEVSLTQSVNDYYVYDVLSFALEI